MKDRAAYAPYQDHSDHHRKAAGLPAQDAVTFAIRAKKVDAFLLRPLKKLRTKFAHVHSNLDVRCGGSLEDIGTEEY